MLHTAHGAHRIARCDGNHDLATFKTGVFHIHPSGLLCKRPTPRRNPPTTLARMVRAPPVTFPQGVCLQSCRARAYPAAGKSPPLHPSADIPPHRSGSPPSLSLYS